MKVTRVPDRVVHKHYSEILMQLRGREFRMTALRARVRNSLPTVSYNYASALSKGILSIGRERGDIRVSENSTEGETWFYVHSTD